MFVRTTEFKRNYPNYTGKPSFRKELMQKANQSYANNWWTKIQLPEKKKKKKHQQNENSTKFYFTTKRKIWHRPINSAGNLDFLKKNPEEPWKRSTWYILIKQWIYEKLFFVHTLWKSIWGNQKSEIEEKKKVLLPYTDLEFETLSYKYQFSLSQQKEKFILNLIFLLV